MNPKEFIEPYVSFPHVLLGYIVGAIIYLYIYIYKVILVQ